ncbi:MAG: 3-hydroxyacyl-CoA dehydrogenase family protein [Actinomycetota bacterium]|nr:3-hydroxyacyl-CoA dehydrogenase family protein [Actinomycetota bacterium]
MVGAGVMGSGIAQVLAVAGYEVICRDVDPKVLDAARNNVDSGRYGVRSAVQRGKLTEPQADAALARLSFTTDVDALADSQVIIEAIPEIFDLKLRFWRELDAIVAESSIFASNSSGFPVSAMAAATNRADRFLGWHWASPAPVMKLAEIIRGRMTSDATVETVVAMASNAGKHPVVINDTDTSWGYVTNRVYFAMVREAMAVVEEGVAERDQVDQLMVDCFRWPTGPFGMARGATSGWN